MRIILFTNLVYGTIKLFFKSLSRFAIYLFKVKKRISKHYFINGKSFAF